MSNELSSLKQELEQAALRLGLITNEISFLEKNVKQDFFELTKYFKLTEKPFVRLFKIQEINDRFTCKGIAVTVESKNDKIESYSVGPITLHMDYLGDPISKEDFESGCKKHFANMQLDVLT